MLWYAFGMFEKIRKNECIKRQKIADFDEYENAADAKKAWLEAAIEEGIEIHEPDSLKEYSGQFKLRMPRSLHRSLVEYSKREGISMNQYCVYLLSKI